MLQHRYSEKGIYIKKTFKWIGQVVEPQNHADVHVTVFVLRHSVNLRFGITCGSTTAQHAVFVKNRVQCESIGARDSNLHNAQ